MVYQINVHNKNLGITTESINQIIDIDKLERLKTNLVIEIDSLDLIQDKSEKLNGYLGLQKLLNKQLKKRISDLKRKEKRDIDFVREKLKLIKAELNYFKSEYRKVSSNDFEKSNVKWKEMS